MIKVAACCLLSAYSIFLLAHSGERHPYAYYENMRDVVSIAACLIAYILWMSPPVKWLALLFVALALLFNPIAPVRMTKRAWQPFDRAAEVVLVIGCVAATFSLKKKVNRDEA